jgi:hypothetical protein
MIAEPTGTDGHRTIGRPWHVSHWKNSSLAEAICSSPLNWTWEHGSLTRLAYRTQLLYVEGHDRDCQLCAAGPIGATQA